MKIHQDTKIYASLLDADRDVVHSLAAGRSAWLQVAAGSVALNDVELKQGDGAAVTEETTVRIAAREPAEVLLFDLA